MQRLTHTVTDTVTVETTQHELRHLLFDSLHWTSLVDSEQTLDPDEWYIDEIQIIPLEEREPPPVQGIILTLSRTRDIELTIS